MQVMAVLHTSDYIVFFMMGLALSPAFGIPSVSSIIKQRQKQLSSTNKILFVAAMTLSFALWFFAAVYGSAVYNPTLDTMWTYWMAGPIFYLLGSFKLSDALK
ncbi:MAG TPA: hypothetical protein VF401_01840 [Candidatus Saccharimonadales bacterium]